MALYPKITFGRPWFDNCFVSKLPDKSVILSEALRGSIANSGLDGAESKDLGDAYRQLIVSAFWPQTTPEDKKPQTPKTRIL
jgi:hypothetical protein